MHFLNLFFFGFRCSSLNRANLKTAYESIGKKMLVPTPVGGTRWLPHTERALKHLITGYVGIVLHLEQVRCVFQACCVYITNCVVTKWACLFNFVYFFVCVFTIICLNQMQQNPSRESSAKARNFLKLLKDKAVILWLHFMMDVIKSLSTVSLKIQDQQSSIGDIYSELDSAKAILEKFKRRYKIIDIMCILAWNLHLITYNLLSTSPYLSLAWFLQCSQK